MHATHQFFLTKRSLYLLVLDARLTQEENRVEYWLKIIQSFGGLSPVLIVGNKTDQHPLDIDRTGLQKKYSNIVGILETSAATGSGIEALKTAITFRVNHLPHVRDLLPETWFTVKTQLESLGAKSNFITYEKYLELCAENEVSDETSQHTLIGFLHDLGVILHFQDDPRLEALGILNPQWVTNGVYKILNSHTLFQNKGVLERAMLDEILNFPEYPANKRLFIVDMMRKFELCYDIEPDKTFLVPDLLPKDEPYTGEWDDALAFQYQYNVLPSSIITRFIVRMNAYIHKTVWRSGVVLNKGGNTALAKADLEDRKIYISVCGDKPTRRDFLSAIRAEFDAIHKTIIKIEAREKVPVPGQANVVVDFEHLLKLERKGVAEFIPEGMDGPVSVRQLLNGVERETDRQRGEPGKRYTQIQPEAVSGVLIVTVTKTETLAVLDAFSVKSDQVRRIISGKTYYGLGVHGGAPVTMVRSEMGTATVGGAFSTISRAIQDIRPQAIVMCGIAYGLRQDKQNLGDILIARQLLNYEPQKVDIKQGQIPRGDRITASERMLDCFRAADIEWSGAPTHFGLMLSGDKLVNDPAFRDWLLETEPEAIGGEMEGTGLYIAARDAKTDWIMVKAICDWADGAKNDDAQKLAAHNAAEFVLHALEMGGWGEAV